MQSKLVWRKDMPKRLLRPRKPSMSTMGFISRQLDKMFFGDEEENEKIFKDESASKMKKRFALNRERHAKNQFI